MRHVRARLLHCDSRTAMYAWAVQYTLVVPSGNQRETLLGGALQHQSSLLYSRTKCPTTGR